MIPMSDENAMPGDEIIPEETKQEPLVEAKLEAVADAAEVDEGPLEIQLKPKKPFKPRKPREEAPAAVRTPELQAKIDAIKGMTAKKHIKIWLLHDCLLSNKEVAAELGTNGGHCGNELKRYNANPELITAALALKPAPVVDPV